jgi:hypothetical protein
MKPHRTHEEVAALKSAILADAMSGDFTVKEIRYRHGISNCYASGLLRTLGYKAMLVSEGERTEILAKRTAGKWRKSA